MYCLLAHVQKKYNEQLYFTSCLKNLEFDFFQNHLYGFKEVNNPNLLISYFYQDSINRLVLGRTYSNLQIGSLYFSYDGLQVMVNNEESIELEVGTWSQSYTVSTDDLAT